MSFSPVNTQDMEPGEQGEGEWFANLDVYMFWHILNSLSAKSSAVCGDRGPVISPSFNELNDSSIKFTT